MSLPLLFLVLLRPKVLLSTRYVKIECRNGKVFRSKTLAKLNSKVFEEPHRSFCTETNHSKQTHLGNLDVFQAFVKRFQPKQK
jgi:hypothetical protein